MLGQMQSAHLKKISWERISIWPLGMGLCKTFVLILLLLLTKCIFRNNIEFLEIKLNSFQNILINEKYRINIDSEQLRGTLFPIIRVLHLFNIRSCSIMSLTKVTNLIFKVTTI